MSEEYCHLLTVPIFPVKDRVVELFSAQTEVLPETEPPTEAASTVIVAIKLLAEEQVPFVTTAL